MAELEQNSRRNRYLPAEYFAMEVTKALSLPANIFDCFAIVRLMCRTPSADMDRTRFNVLLDAKMIATFGSIANQTSTSGSLSSDRPMGVNFITGKLPSKKLRLRAVRAKNRPFADNTSSAVPLVRDRDKTRARCRSAFR